MGVLVPNISCLWAWPAMNTPTCLKLKKFLFSWSWNEQIALSYVKKDANCIQGQTIAIECVAPAVYVANVFHQGQQVTGSCVESATLTWPLMATEPSVLRRKCSHLISSYPSALCFVLVVFGLQEFLFCSPFNQVWVKNCNKQSGFYFCLPSVPLHLSFPATFRLGYSAFL